VTVQLPFTDRISASKITTEKLARN